MKSSAEDVILPSIRLELPACRGKGCREEFAVKFPVGNKEERIHLSLQRRS